MTELRQFSLGTFQQWLQRKERKKLRLVKGMKITSDLAIPEQSDMPKSEESIPKLLVLGQCVGLALFSA